MTAHTHRDNVTRNDCPACLMGAHPPGSAPEVIDARGNIDDFRGDRDPGVVGSWLARQVAIEHRLRYAINKLRREGYPSDEITAAITRILGETDGAE